MKPLHYAIAAAVLIVAAMVLLLSSPDAGRGSARRAEGRGTELPGAGDTRAEAAAADANATDAGAGALAITLRVLGPGDEAAGGAEAEIDGGLDVVRATAGADGELRVRGLAPGVYDLRARQGRLTGALRFELMRSRDLGTLRLTASVAVRGRVFGARGEPLAGARVEAVRAAPRQGFDITAAVRAMVEPEEVVARAATAGDGAYELLLGEGGTFGLRASAPGHAQEGDPPQAYTADADGIDFHLMPGALLQGRVVDPRQNPVAGARVFVVDPFSVLGRRLPKTETATDASGAFSLILAPARQNMLVVRAAGFATYMNPGVTLPQANFIVVLEEGFTMRLQTVDAERPEVPAPRINVVATINGSFAGGQTDDGGMLVLENIATKGQMSGRQRDVILWGGGYVAQSFRPGSAEPVNGVLDLGVIKMQRGGVIRGRVLDKATGEPIAEARVRTVGGLDQNLEMFATAGAVSAPDGAFELTGVPLAAHTLMAIHPDYVSEIDPMTLFGGGRGLRGSGPPLFLEGRREIVKDVELTPADSVTGIVLLPDGAPAAGARVEVRDQNAIFAQILGAGPTWTTADAQGRFALGGLKRGEEVEIAATHREYGASETVRTRAGEGETATLRLAEPLIVKGVVVEEGGAPVASVRVQVQRAGEQRQFGPPDDAGTARPALTDAQGRYLVRNAPPGELMVEFEHPDYAPVSRALQLAPGAAPQDLGRTVLPRGGTIAGVAVDADGQPVAGIGIHASRQGLVQAGAVGRSNGNAVSDDKGRFAIQGLQEGEFRLRTFNQNYYSDNPVVVAGTLDVRFLLRAAGRLVGRVIGRGQPVEGATLRAERSTQQDGESLGWARTGPDGTFEMRPVPPDEPFTLVVEHDGFRRLELQGVRASEHSRDFVIQVGQEIAGLVVDVRGQGVANAAVQVRGGIEHTKTVRTNAMGAFAAGGLGEGEIVVRLTESGQGFIETDWMVVAPGSRDVRLVATPGESISGVLRDREGSPVQQARVEAVNAQGHSEANAWVWADDGAFELRGLRPGTYTLRATRFIAGETQRRTPVEVVGVATGTKDVVIRFDG